jgi:hypothetical protein
MMLLLVGCGSTQADPMQGNAPGPAEPGPTAPGPTAPGTPRDVSSDGTHAGGFAFDPVGGTVQADVLGEPGRVPDGAYELPEQPEREIIVVDAAAEPPAPPDPCTLVTDAEWTAWAGPGGRIHIHLEDGEVCGFINREDTLRMAVGWLPHLGGDRFLAPDDRAAGRPVRVQGHGGLWLAGWPVPQSSMLVLELEDGDLGVEMSSLGGVPDDDLLAAAQTFAEHALGRLR